MFFNNLLEGFGYQEADTIYPGYGYWVKVNQDGIIMLSSDTSESSGTPCPGIPTVEYEDKIYNTVLIGSQCWLKENLDIGMMIQGSENQTDNSTIEKYCYDDNTANCETYGGLYQWNEAMQYTTLEGVQGICPDGFHIPTYTDFQTLSSVVGGDGNPLKAIGQGEGDGTGTNTSGFSALLGGYRYDNGLFYYLSIYSIFQSSTENSSTDAYFMSMDYDNNGIYQNYVSKGHGFSVRCLKDTWTCGNTIDYSGKIYNTVQIGSQCLLKENLDVGIRIDGSSNQTDNGVIEKYCYNDDPSNCEVYGGLYQWDEAMKYTTSEGTQGICPSGWHILTYSEFQTLSTTVGDDGNALKAIGQGTGDGAGTNTSGFTAILAGNRDHVSGFWQLGNYAIFWSSTEYNGNTSNFVYLYYTNNVIGFNQNYKANGSSVRCMKD